MSPDARQCVTLQEQNAKLRQDNATLTEHLEMAVANIQRFTLENRQLRKELESATKITRINTKTKAT
jgi:regulator of replication initiation timing